MSQPIQFKSTASRFANLVVLIPLVLVCLALSPAPNAFAVTPAPDGGYPGGNTAEGEDALFSLTTGLNNTAVGFNALYNNTTATNNTANGAFALYSNTTGENNTATGVSALNGNTTGGDNTAMGWSALANNTTGNDNIAVGETALFDNSTGIDNTAVGLSALGSNTTGSLNVATGNFALFSNTTGTDNTANGLNALYSNTSGSDNIALGENAGSNLTTGNNNIDIGNAGLKDEANTIRIGTVGTQTRAFMAGIYGTVISGTPVKINSSGQLGVTPSSARFKRDIHNMERASDVLLALRPVTFHYKPEIDPEGSRQFGLVAEEVEKVNPDLVVYDPQGKPYTVRYEAVNAMLLNEFLEEHQTVQKLEAALAAVNQRLKEQDAKIDKVNAKVELSRPAPQIVENR
jgi:hypothetical protein